MIDITTRRTHFFVSLIVALAILLIGGLLALQIDMLAETEDIHLARDFLISIVFSGALFILAIGGYLFFRSTVRQRKSDMTARQQAGDALKLYLRALEASTSGVVLMDARKTTYPILYANPAFEHMTGYAVHEVLGKQWDFLQGADHEQPASIELRQAIHQARSCMVEVQNFRKDGALLWNEVSLAPVLDDAGAITHFVAIFNDITARRQTEESLRNSQQFVERINDLIPDSVYILDLYNQRTVYHNAALNSIRDHLPDAARSGGWEAILSITHPEDAAQVVNRFPILYQAADGDVVEIEYRMRHRDGSWHWYHDRETVFSRDAQGNSSHVIGSSVDITARKQTEENLRQSQQFVERINDLIPDSVYILDFAEQRTIYQNRAMAALLGYSEADTPQEGWDSRLSNLHPDDLEVIFVNLNRFFELPKDGIVESEQRFRHKNGDWRWFSVRETIFAHSEDGVPTQILGVARDVTERKQTEEALRSGEERYRELYATSQRHAQELSLLDQVRTALLSEIDLSALMRVIVEGIAETFGYGLVSIYLLEGDMLRLQHQVGYDQVISEFPSTKGVTGRVIRSQEAVLLEDVGGDPDFLGAIEGIQSEVCVPLFDQERVVGVLNVESTGDIRLDEQDLQLMTALSEQLSIAIGRARLYNNLQKSEERYRVVSDLISDYAYSFDVAPDGTLIHDWVTDSFSRLTGYGFDEAASNTSTQLLYHPDEQGHVKRDLEITLAGKPTDGEYRILTKSGEERWVRIYRRPVWDEQQKRVVKIYGVAQDITTSILAEQIVQAYVAEVEDLYNHAPCSYHSLGPDGIFVRINDTGLEWLGYSRDEVVSHMKFTDFLTDAGRQTFVKAFPDFQKSGRVDDLEYELSRKDGTLFTVLLSASAAYDEEGNFVMSRATMFDITDRKRIEAAEREQRAVAEGFRDIATRLSQTLDLDEVLDIVLVSIQRVVPHNTASVMLIENERGHIVRHSGFNEEEIEKMVVGHSFTVDDLETLRQIMTTRQPMIVADTESYEGWRTLSLENRQHQQSYMGVPIFLDDEIVGILHLTSPEKYFFTSQHAERLTDFATQAAIAIQNARLYKQAQELAMLEERQRLARDLHDAVSQTLFSASVVAETLPRIWERQNPDDIKGGLEELRLLTRGALAEMRTLLAELRPNALVETPMSHLLKQLIDAATGHIQIPVTLEIVADEKPLPAEVKIVFYRIAQESLSNIIKHARARQVSVTFSYQDGVADLQISDDGRGFDLTQPRSGHYGLQIMHERAEAVGVNLTVTSQPGSGTRVTLDWRANAKEGI